MEFHGSKLCEATKRRVLYNNKKNIIFSLSDVRRRGYSFICQCFPTNLTI